jgi:DNA invertase Pin-like site-specific DNA recombinase
LSLQLDALRRAGCERIFEDKINGAKDDRPGLQDAMSHLRSGDVLTVWKLDRLGRTVSGLIELAGQLRERGVDLAVLSGPFPVDTSSASGKFMFHMLRALSEMERDLIRERTLAGLAAARQRGRVGDRREVMGPKQIACAREMLERGVTIKEVAARLRVARGTVYRTLKLTDGYRQP